jgi:hypothetical protein
VGLAVVAALVGLVGGGLGGDVDGDAPKRFVCSINWHVMQQHARVRALGVRNAEERNAEEGNTKEDEGLDLLLRVAQAMELRLALSLRGRAWEMRAVGAAAGAKSPAAHQQHQRHQRGRRQLSRRLGV